MEKMPVMTEAITATSDRLRVLSLDRQIEVVGYVLNDFVTGAVGSDVPAVPTDRQSECQKQRGDLRIRTHRAARVDRVRPRQFRHGLCHIDERGPRG